MEPVSLGFTGFLLKILQAFGVVVLALSGVGMQHSGRAQVQPRVLALEIRAGEEVFRPAAEVLFAPSGGRGMPEVTLLLSAPDGAVFAAFSRRHQGEELALSVCGEVLLRPRLLMPVEGGRLSLSGPEVVEKLRIFLEEGCP